MNNGRQRRGGRFALRYETVANGEFLQALDVLSAETDLPVKERYALARTRRDVAQAMGDFGKLRAELVKKYGKPEREVRERQLAKAKKEKNAPLITALQARLETVLPDSYIIEDGNESAVEGWKKELAELNATKFEIFLDHKITLPEAATISGKDIAALIDIIAEPA